MPIADLALLNFDCPLVDPDVVAIGITQGRITQLWTDRGDVSARTFMDVEGASVLPGIDDSHLHGYEYGRSLTALNVGKNRAPDLAAFRAALAGARPESTGWIRGIGWDGTDFLGSGPNGTLSTKEIDDVTGDVPVVLTDVTGHQALVNSTALKLAGIGPETPDPEGGSFLRFEGGEPSGLILEAAVGRINEAIGPLGAGEQESAILAAQESLARAGVVAFTDPGLGPGAATLMDGTGDLGAVTAYRRLSDSGELKLRANIMLLFGGLGGTTASAVAAGLDDFGPPQPMAEFGRLGIAQLKVFADGIPRSRTAWMNEPYDDCTHGRLQVAGTSDAERIDQLNLIVKGAALRGWQVGAHTIGDLAITHVVNSLVAPSSQVDRLRHYVIHGDFICEDDIERISRYGITLNANPSIRWQVGGSVSPIIGEERNSRRQPLRSAVDAGANVCLSSDAPVASPKWQEIVAAAMTRSWKSDPQRSDDQKLSAHEALLGMTEGAAWQSHAENWRGSLSIGKAADFIVLGSTIDWKDAAEIAHCSVARTVIQGETVFEE